MSFCTTPYRIVYFHVFKKLHIKLYKIFYIYHYIVNLYFRYTWERGGHILKTKEYSEDEIQRIKFIRPSMNRYTDSSENYLLPSVSGYDIADSSLLHVNDPFISDLSYNPPGIESFMYGAQARDANLPLYGGNSGGTHFERQFLSESDVTGNLNVDLTGQPLGKLLLKEVTRKESGKYSVIASSSRGSINSSFTIDVLCK